jgi:hypothetical protein
MKMIKLLSEEIRHNIREAKEKIEMAYKMRDADKSIGDWYKDMAVKHLAFNDTGHSNVVRLIKEAEETHKTNPLYAGMLVVYNEMHADIMAESAEVQGMISAYK